MKAAPMCFGLQGNHHQGATTKTYLKLQAWFNVHTKDTKGLLFLHDNAPAYWAFATQKKLAYLS